MNEVNTTLFAEVPSSDEVKKQLRRDYINKYNEINKDKINERRRLKRANRPEDEAAKVRLKNAEYSRNRYSENKEARIKSNESSKKYREANLESLREKDRINGKNRRLNLSKEELVILRNKEAEKMRRLRANWTDEQKELAHQKRVEYYYKHRQECIDRVIAYKNNNREAVAAYRKKYNQENPEIIRTYSRKRRAMKAAVGGEHTPEDIQQLRVLQKDKCALCLCSIKQSRHVDHIVPISRGGSNDKYNLQLLCQTCNQRKHAKDPIEFNQSLGLLL